MRELRPLLLVALLLSLSLPALADRGDADAAAAIVAFDQARALRQSGEIGAACEKFALSYQLDPQLGALLHLADCREANHQFASAWSAFRDAEELAQKLGDERVGVAHRRALAVQERRSWLRFELPGQLAPGLTIGRNGALLPAPLWTEAQPLDAGSYQIVVSAPGYGAFSATVELTREGQVEILRIPPLTPVEASVLGILAGGAVRPYSPETRSGAGPGAGGSPSSVAPASPEDRGGSWQRPLGWVGVGLGAAGLTLGVLTGTVLLVEWNGLGCDPGPCAASPEEAAGLNSLRTVSGVGLIAGGTLVATGATLLLTAPEPPQTAGLRPYVSGASAGLVGRF